MWVVPIRYTLGKSFAAAPTFEGLRAASFQRERERERERERASERERERESERERERESTKNSSTLWSVRSSWHF